eukprot:2716516-Amphidinium_carterae.1
MSQPTSGKTRKQHSLRNATDRETSTQAHQTETILLLANSEGSLCYLHCAKLLILQTKVQAQQANKHRIVIGVAYATTASGRRFPGGHCCSGSRCVGPRSASKHG